MSHVSPPYRIQVISGYLFWLGLLICILFGLAVSCHLTGCAYTDARISVSGGSRATIDQAATTAKPVTLEGLNQAALGDAAIGALAGGAAGSVVPGVGTAAGAAAGAATGAILSPDTTAKKVESEVKPDPASTPGGG